MGDEHGMIAHPSMIDVLKAAADRPANHRYPESDGLPELRQAIARYPDADLAAGRNQVRRGAKKTLPLLQGPVKETPRSGRWTRFKLRLG